MERNSKSAYGLETFMVARERQRRPSEGNSGNNEASTDSSLVGRRPFAHTGVLTIAEAAKELRCSKAHLAKVLKNQVPGLPHLPHLCLGRRKLIRRSVLYQWMAE